MPAALVVELDADERFDWHSHDQHQLAFAARGVLVVAVDGASWVLPRYQAIWIPSGVRHAVGVAGDTTMVNLYIEASRCPLTFTEPAVVDAGGLVGELASHLSRLELTSDERSRAEAVLWDLVRPLPVTALSPPMPRDDRARRLADALLADVADPRSLADWGRSVGASARTLSRIFPEETGLAFARWRTRARLSAALPLLRSGLTVTAVAGRVGYATPSAFVAAFRREIGTTPARYFERR